MHYNRITVDLQKMGGVPQVVQEYELSLALASWPGK